MLIYVAFDNVTNLSSYLLCEKGKTLYVTIIYRVSQEERT
jgi:hypothetical protein